MFNVVIKVEVTGAGPDEGFENNATVEYKNVRSKEQANYIQKAVSDALFSLGQSPTVWPAATPAPAKRSR